MPPGLTSIPKMPRSHGPGSQADVSKQKRQGLDLLGLKSPVSPACSVGVGGTGRSRTPKPVHPEIGPQCAERARSQEVHLLCWTVDGPPQVGGGPGDPA